MAELIGLAIRPARKAPMETLNAVDVTADGGLAGDHAGKYPDRMVTILDEAAWHAALSDLELPIERRDALDWTVRRANLLTRGAALPRAKGGVVQVGDVQFEVTGQTWPCKRMEEAQTGLLKALAKDWRGGVTCRVLVPGEIAVGDPVSIPVSPPEMVRRLP
ncbi:MAG: MOSC domain-containing protein [Pseudomonadota bacterium]